MKTVILLADYADIVNKHGPDSKESKKFLKKHKKKKKFLELAAMARLLKKALTS